MVTLGDSITQSNDWFTTANLSSGSRYAVPQNAGVGGNWTTDMLARLNTDVIAYHPYAVTVLGGTNDIGNNATAASVIANLTAIISQLLAANIKRIFLGTITPRGSVPPPNFAPMTPSQVSNFQQVNTWIRTQGTNNVFIADWSYALSTGGDGSYPDLSLFIDHVHPNAAGRAIMGSILSPLLATI